MITERKMGTGRRKNEGEETGRKRGLTIQNLKVKNQNDNSKCKIIFCVIFI
jgi:hypothetical protein